MTKFSSPQQAASYAADHTEITYVRSDGDDFIVTSNMPDSPPFVAATPEDGTDTILARIVRLATDKPNNDP